MPTLHLTKVAVACRDIEALQQRIAARVVGGEVSIVTRMRPKRASELVGGSLVWIVKNRLVAAQEIFRFEDREDGRIDIVCSAELRAIPPVPRRAHQGWRYFETGDALSEAGDSTGLADLPPGLYNKLAGLALV